MLRASPSALQGSVKPRSVKLAAPCKLTLRRGPVRVRCEAGSYQPEPFGLAPVNPKTAYGEMLGYYLKMEPQLFKAAVEDQLNKLRDEKDAKEQSAMQQQLEGKNQTDLTLYKRMEEVRAVEVRATLEDLMYVSILEKFLVTGVNMLPRMDGFVDPPPTNLKALTEGLHSREALELVREHLLGVMGPAADQYSNAYVKMSKFQMAQVYAASIMFGYFLRRVNQRFQLDKVLGTAPISKDDAVERLERLFATAADMDSAGNPDYANAETVDLDSPTPSISSASSSSSSNLPTKKPKSDLRKYVENFDQATMLETAKIVSAEGAALVERQTCGLLGDIKKLTTQIQDVVGTDATSMQEVMQRMAKAVEQDKVETVTMTVGTQRRAVLEAVAFGTFLRDVESWVQTDYNLLTPLPAPRLPSQ